MPCPTLEELDDWVAEGTRDGPIGAHVNECPTCREKTSELDANERMLAEIRAVFPREDARLKELLSVPAGIAGYRIEKEIGRGAMGVVYLAHEPRPRRQVALKVIEPAFCSERMIVRFELEAEILARFDHPCIAHVYSAGRAQTPRGFQPYMAMEYVQGERLDRWVQSASLQPRAILELLVRVTDAVHHAHQRGVIHRDLKPANILVTREGVPKVLDFGIARMAGSEARPTKFRTLTGQVLGTPPYMSPEQLAGSSDLDVRMDVYSLGVVAYELLARRLPYDLAGKSLPEAALILEKTDAPPLRVRDRRIADDTAVVVATAMDRDRSRRYASVAAFADDLRSILSSRPTVARPPTRRERAVKWVRRNPTKSVAAAVATAAFAAISFLFAANVRANRELKLTNTTLDARNTELDAEINSVKRLSALQELDDLLAEADNPQLMWPPHPDPERIERYRKWIDRAQKLVDDVQVHRNTREELRRRAPPRTEDGRRRECESHPRYRELQLLEGKLLSKRRALAQRRDEITAEIPDLRGRDLPGEPCRLLAMAAPLVDDERKEYGEEPLVLALTLRALELSVEDPALRVEAQAVLSRAYFALGRDDDALNAAYEAVEAATEQDKERFAASLAKLEADVTKAVSEKGLRGLEQEIAALDEERAALDAVVDERRDWQFPDEHAEARWWNNQLTKLIEGLEALADPETGLLGEAAISPDHGWSIPKRLAFAERLRDSTAEGGEWCNRWQGAIAAIRRDPRYGELELAPQDGLIPIGPDPISGLWEFLHVATGDQPERGADGKLVLTGETGLVLVLIPGGSFCRGGQSEDPNAHNYDPQVRSDENPVRAVRLSAYFVSKYEMTQGQWKRVTGRNPSFYGPDGQWSRTWLVGGKGASLLHPVEQVSWIDCMRELPRIGLGLPSEAQWENGCRGGTETPWWTGRETGSLQGAANVGDVYAEVHGGPEDWPCEEWLDDGATTHAPIGTYASNGFGLHEVHGNVWELCLDGYDPGFYEHGPGSDPVAPWQGAGNLVLRGGGFDDPAVGARSAYRGDVTPSRAEGNLGVRPARAIEP